MSPNDNLAVACADKPKGALLPRGLLSDRQLVVAAVVPNRRQKFIFMRKTCLNLQLFLQFQAENDCGRFGSRSNARAVSEATVALYASGDRCQIEVRTNDRGEYRTSPLRVGESIPIA